MKTLQPRPLGFLREVAPQASTCQVRQQAHQSAESDACSPQQRDSPQNDPLVSTVDLTDLREASAAAEEHWRSLYGQPPGPTVIEAAMTWLAEMSGPAPMPVMGVHSPGRLPMQPLRHSVPAGSQAIHRWVG